MSSIRKSWIEKLNEVKKVLKTRFPELEMRDLRSKMSEIAHYHYNKRNSMILGKDKEIYNILIKNSFNPYTVYRWLLLERVPEDIRFQLKEKQISQKKAFRLAMERKRETNSELGSRIKQLGLQLVRGM